MATHQQYYRVFNDGDEDRFLSNVLMEPHAGGYWCGPTWRREGTP